MSTCYQCRTPITGEPFFLQRDGHRWSHCAECARTITELTPWHVVRLHNRITQMLANYQRDGFCQWCGVFLSKTDRPNGECKTCRMCTPTSPFDPRIVIIRPRRKVGEQ